MPVTPLDSPKTSYAAHTPPITTFGPTIGARPETAAHPAADGLSAPHASAAGELSTTEQHAPGQAQTAKPVLRAPADVRQGTATTSAQNVWAWLRSDKALAVACGVLAGVAATLFAPAAWPTTTLLYNQALLSTAASLGAWGAVKLQPDLPFRLLGAAFAGLLGAALLVYCAPAAAPAYVAGAALLSAGIGYKASQHLQTIGMAVVATGAAATLWWSASMVGPKVGICLPALALA